ncbi:PAS domain-containing sensor histidine kinase [Candidatus Peregrinibacteria bacterium]|nr:MAG: PAS domain-containing sensor histidine kinase [Candidatus Peregrinibacteria bacterium]
MFQLLPTELSDRLSATLKLVIKERQTHSFEYSFQLQKNSKPFYLEARVSPINQDEVLVIVRDISIRKQNQETKNRLAGVMEATTDLVLFVGMNENVLYVNQAGLTLLGHTHQTASLTLGKIMDHASYESIGHEALVHAAREGSWRGEAHLLHRGGKRIPVSLVVIPHRSEEGGEVDFFSVIARDITEEKRVDEAKTEFITVASHELRSPLTSIRGYLSFLTHEETLESLPESVRDYLQRAYENVDSLGNLVNNLLDVSQIHTNRLTLHRGSVDLAQTLEKTCRFLTFLTDQKKLHLTFDYAKDGVWTGYFDGIRLQQVFRNLLENAIKFSPRGKSLAIQLAEKNDCFSISIRDQGVGIPQSQLSSIFDKFKQAKGSQSRYRGGAGLGLYIAKNIVELHGGSIQVNSQLRKGSEFIIQLPRT